MSTVLLKPQAKQLFEVQPQQSHPRISLRRVLWIKLIRWIDKTSLQTIWKTIARLSCVLLIALGVLAPQFTLGFLTASAKWNGYKIPLFLGLLALTLNAKRLWLFSKRTTIKRRGSNQHTYHGIPVGEFASWLLEAKAFKRDDAMRKWGLSQGAYHRIAQELDQHVLTRGENNARVLRDITMEQLVLQLRDKFPLVWSEEHQTWAERNGAMERWALSHDAKQRKLEEATAKRERKLERIEEKIKERAAFANLWSPVA